MLVGVNIFSSILDLLFPPRTDELLVRAASGEMLAGLVEPKVAGEATALLPFHDERVRALVHEAKYHGSTKAFELLAGVLGDYLAEQKLARAVVVPVPLGARRRAERGYNQAEEVARRAARRAGLEMNPALLVRTRDTPSQTNLARWQRRENVTNAFLCPAGLTSEEKNRTYIVVDDVTTTGATLAAASQALRASGAARVIAIALAH
jgi:ComF family protein